jgi:hypothetical protein
MSVSLRPSSSPVKALRPSVRGASLAASAVAVLGLVGCGQVLVWNAREAVSQSVAPQQVGAFTGVQTYHHTLVCGYADLKEPGGGLSVRRFVYDHNTRRAWVERVTIPLGYRKMYAPSDVNVWNTCMAGSDMRLEPKAGT